MKMTAIFLTVFLGLSSAHAATALIKCDASTLETLQNTSGKIYDEVSRLTTIKIQVLTQMAQLEEIMNELNTDADRVRADEFVKNGVKTMNDAIEGGKIQAKNKISLDLIRKINQLMPCYQQALTKTK